MKPIIPKTDIAHKINKTKHISRKGLGNIPTTHKSTKNVKTFQREIVCALRLNRYTFGIKGIVKYPKTQRITSAIKSAVIIPIAYI